MDEKKMSLNVNEAIDKIQKEVKEAGDRFDMLLRAGKQQCNCQQQQPQLPSLSQFVADLVEQEMESMTYLKSLSANEMMDDTIADAYKEHLTNIHECFMTAVRALR